VLTSLVVVLALGGVPWALSLAGLPRWVRQTRLRLESATRPVRSSLHVVVPARDEAATIGDAVRGLRSVPGALTVSVIDDGSSDGTGYLARQAGADDPRITITSAPERPVGWSGKAWACHQGAQLAGEAEWLLFVDADVRLDARLPRALQDAADAREADLISAFGTWDLPGPGARWLVPALGWLIRGWVDAGRVQAGAQAFANGQVLMVRRAVYERVGGHGAVRSDVLDDVGLARAVQVGGGRLAVVWVPEGFVVRAYASAGELVRGYRKNLHAGLGRRRLLGVVAAMAVLWAFLGPVVALTLALVLGRGPVLLGACGLAALLPVLVRFVVERLDGRAGWFAPLQPLAGVPIAWAFLTSALARTSTWKGRAFVDGRVAAEEVP